MNNNATFYAEFKLYFNRLNTYKKVRHLLVLRIFLIRFRHLGKPVFLL